MVQREEADARRGSLRIYFGASAGVGKTYAMLAAARALRAEGKDVVIGIVETHGRKETEALLQGLEVLPLARIDVNGTKLPEFDLDAAIRRHPALILVDELAHTNVAGSRHPKRWQDVEELLAAGIDVFTTLNVQHLESLNDVVGGITGIQVWETLPDTFFDEADEVILVDCPGRRSPRPAQGRQGVRAGADRARGRQFLPQGQPDGAARARAAPHRGSHRNRCAGLSRRQGDRARVEDRGVAALLRRSRRRRRSRGAKRIAPRDAARRRMDRRLRRDAAPRPPARGKAGPDPAHREARAGARRPDRDSVRQRHRRGDRRLRAFAQLLEADRRTQHRGAPVVPRPRHRRAHRRPCARNRPDRDRARRDAGTRAHRRRIAGFARRRRAPGRAPPSLRLGTGRVRGDDADRTRARAVLRPRQPRDALPAERRADRRTLGSRTRRHGRIRQRRRVRFLLRAAALFVRGERRAIPADLRHHAGRRAASSGR